VPHRRHLRAPRLGVVLAAGAGVRFGGPKIAAADGAWLAAATQALREGGCDEIAVCMGAQIVDLPPGITGIEVPDWTDGLSASVRAAIEHAGRLGSTQLLLHLVDLPDVGADVVARVVTAAAGAGPAGLARAAYGGRPGHPVLVGAMHFAPMLATLRGDAGGRGYLADQRGLVIVECGDLASGADVDRRPGVPDSAE